MINSCLLNTVMTATTYYQQGHLLLAKATSPSSIGFRLEFNLKMFMTRTYLGGGPPYDEDW
jgi:hypothetical protein